MVSTLLCRLEPILGGLEPAQMREGVATAVETKIAEWGLDAEVAGWDLGPVPTARQLGDALLDGLLPPLEWNRLSFFQDVTLRLIAASLLPKGHGATYVQGCACSRGFKPGILPCLPTVAEGLPHSLRAASSLANP